MLFALIKHNLQKISFCRKFQIKNQLGKFCVTERKSKLKMFNLYFNTASSLKNSHGPKLEDHINHIRMFLSTLSGTIWTIYAQS